MTEEQLNAVLTPGMFRHKGFCIRGTKKYGESLGFSFKDLTQGNLTVRDLEPHKNDAFVQALLKYNLGEDYGW